MFRKISIFGFVSIIASGSVASFAQTRIQQQRTPPPEQPSRILVPPRTVIEPTRSALDRTPAQPNAWQRIQDPIDRSTGRIVGESLYQTEQLQRLQDERAGRIVEQREFDRFQEERERRLRIDAQAQGLQTEQQRQRQTELDQRERELVRTAALSPEMSAARVDEQALLRARSLRDEQSLSADRARAELLRQQPDNRAQIDADHQWRLDVIRQAYNRERARILGIEPAPATQPTTP